MSEKVAIITAAGQGLGKSIAEKFRDNGYKLALMSVSENAEKLATSMGMIGMQGSVTSVQDLQELVDRTITTYGRVDVVVNNTGHPPKGSLLELTDEDWHSGLDLVLLNVIKMSRMIVPHMEKQGAGSIVNISTFAAFEPSLKFPISSALRSALGSFCKLFADEYASKKIRMNNVLPGYMDNYAVDEKTLNSIPMERAASTHEVAEAALFLASEKASYITGQNLRVDGGITRSV